MTSITKIEIRFFKNLTNNQQNKNNSYLYEDKEDLLVAEIPVALVYNGISHAVMMCSPQNLEDFALGFSLAEGIIQHPREIYSIEVKQQCQGIEVHIELATRCFVALKEKRRTLVGRTGCGVCGSEQLAQVQKNLPILDRTLSFNLQHLDHCLSTFSQAQVLAEQTGATHAAAYFDLEGNLLAIREDVGRHVALDKLLGWYAKAQVAKGFVLISSRASYEMVQKAVTCGIEVLVAISAPTDLAVNIAKQSNLTLIGFARKGRANIYSGKERLVFITDSVS